MITANIHLGEQVDIAPSASINNLRLGNRCKLAVEVRLFGNPEHILEVGEGSYFGPGTIVEGYNAPVKIGSFVSFAQNVNLMSGSGPNASERMQRLWPIEKAGVSIGDHSWIGASVIIMPGVHIGRYCIVAAHSFVNQSFPDYSIIGGTPARLLRSLTESEIQTLNQ